MTARNRERDPYTTRTGHEASNSSYYTPAVSRVRVYCGAGLCLTPRYVAVLNSLYAFGLSLLSTDGA